MRWIKTGFAWLVDKGIEHWPTIISVGGASLMAYLASISAWLAPYGPVAWGGVAVATILFLSLAVLLFGFAREHLALADYVKTKAAAIGTNVLAPTHRNERIELTSFYHPYFKPTENVHFEDCDLLGPGWVGIEGCNFVQSGFIDCEIVIVRPGRPVKGAMAFKFCTFVRCRLYRVTWLMSHEQYKQLPQDMRAVVRVISDGRVGDI